MGYLQVRRAAIVGSSALLMLLPLAVAAHAEPRSEPAPQVGAEQLPSELVDAISRDLKISPDEYLDRATRAQQLGDYANTLRTSDPDSFAGAWLGDDGSPIVAVTNEKTAARVAQDGYQAKIAAVSADSLDETLQQLNHWASQLPSDQANQVTATSIDVLNNKVTLGIADSELGRALSLPDLFARVQVAFTPGGVGPINPGPIGGDTYITTALPLNSAIPPESIGVCSFGFNSVDSSGNPINISAGHCNPNREASGTDSAARVYLPNRDDVAASPEIGRFERSTVGDTANGLDYSLIKLNTTGAKAGLVKPEVRGALASSIAVTGTARPVVGAPVCKSGQTSAYTCGLILADDVETKLHAADGSARVVRGFSSTACTLTGDSGGAIVTGTLALGITSGSNVGDAPNCETANLQLARDGGTINLGMPIEQIVADVNATTPAGNVGSGISIRTS